MPNVIIATSADGDTVAEADLSEPDAPDVAELLQIARAKHAHRAWAHSQDDLTAAGFARCDGYARLEAAAPAAGGSLPPLRDTAVISQLRHDCYRGMWGHKQPDPQYTVVAGAVDLGLREGDDWVGVCRVEPAERYVDGPGVLPDFRDPARAQLLLAAACALLGPGPVVVDTWGEPQAHLAAYGELGFVVAAQVPGWELRL